MADKWIRHEMPALPVDYSWRIDYVRESKQVLIRLCGKMKLTGLGVALAQGTVPLGENTPHLLSAACVEVAKGLLKEIGPLEIHLPDLYGFTPGEGVVV